MIPEKCNEIYPELQEYCSLLKGTETTLAEDYITFALRGKIYAMIKSDSDGDVSLMTLTEKDQYAATMYMIKDVSEREGDGKLWACVKLTGSLPYEFVQGMLQSSYNTVLRHFPKKVQHELLEDIWQ